MARPRVLITGITGMVGSHLADFLLEQTDWDIIGMCRWRSPMDNSATCRPAHQPRRPRLSAVRRPARHLVDPRRGRQGARPDYVFHLAAQSFPRTSFDAPLDTMDTNVQGTVRVLDALQAACAQGGDPCLRLVRGVRPRAEGEAADRRGVLVSSRLRPTPSPRSAPTWSAASMPRPTA